MIDFEGNVEDGFRGLAVFTPVPGPFGDEGIVWVHLLA
jgi:hypothetical protein